MSGKIAIFEDSYVAGADLSAHQYKAVKLTSLNTVGLVTAATDQLAGILQNKPRQGEAARVMKYGRTAAQSDGAVGAIAAGDLVGPDVNARMIKKIAGSAGIVGVAEEASTALGTIIDITLAIL